MKQRISYTYPVEGIDRKEGHLETIQVIDSAIIDLPDLTGDNLQPFLHIESHRTPYDRHVYFQPEENRYWLLADKNGDNLNKFIRTNGRAPGSIIYNEEGSLNFLVSEVLQGKAHRGRFINLLGKTVTQSHQLMQEVKAEGRELRLNDLKNKLRNFGVSDYGLMKEIHPPTLCAKDLMNSTSLFVQTILINLNKHDGEYHHYPLDMPLEEIKLKIEEDGKFLEPPSWHLHLFRLDAVPVISRRAP